ncbi:serine/arginine repetitive matrix protein 5-like isoform X2 [Artemia franciscana]|uniref:serine/arginine repetitive matrix protein 5-like isoform X2 n=1 Tax=Artemia franciscana TaxID=6661 RepID=UPI0032D9E6EF
MGDYYRSRHPYQQKPTLGGSSSSANILNPWPRHINWPQVQKSGNVSKSASSFSSFNSSALVYRETEVNPEVSQYSTANNRHKNKNEQKYLNMATAASSPGLFLPVPPAPLLKYPHMEKQGTSLQSQYGTLLPLPDEQSYDVHENKEPMYSNIRHNEQIQSTSNYQLPKRARVISKGRQGMQKYPSNTGENWDRWDSSGQRNHSKKLFTNNSDGRFFDRKTNATFGQDAGFHEDQFSDQQGHNFYRSDNYSYTERESDQYKIVPLDLNDQDTDYYTDNANCPDIEEQYYDSIDNNFPGYEDMAGENNAVYPGEKISVGANLGLMKQRPKYPTSDNRLEAMEPPVNSYPNEYVSMQGRDVPNEIMFQGRVDRPYEKASNEMKRKAPMLKSGQFHPSEGKQRLENTLVLHSERNFGPDLKIHAVLESVEPTKNTFSLMGTGLLFKPATERVALLPTPVARKTLLDHPHPGGQYTASRHNPSPSVGFSSLGKYDDAESPKNHGKESLPIDWTMLSKAVEAASNVSNRSQIDSREESSSQPSLSQLAAKLAVKQFDENKKGMTSVGNRVVTSDKAAELLQTWECLMSGVEIPLEQSSEIRPEPKLEKKAREEPSSSRSSRVRITPKNRSPSPGRRRRRRSSNRMSSQEDADCRSVRLEKSKSRRHRSPSCNTDLVRGSRKDFRYRSIEGSIIRESINKRVAHSPIRSPSNGKRSRSPERLFDRKFNERHINLMTDDIDSVSSGLGVQNTNYKKTRRSTSLETLRRGSTDIRQHSPNWLGSLDEYDESRRKRRNESAERRRLRSRSRPHRGHRSPRRNSRRSESRTNVRAFSPPSIGADYLRSPLRKVWNQSPSNAVFQMRSRSVTPVKIVHEDELELTVKSRMRSQSPLFPRLGRDRSSPLRMAEPRQITDCDLRWRLKSLENRDYSPISDADHSPARSLPVQEDLRHVLLRRWSPGPEAVPVRIEKLSRSRTRSNSPDLARRKYLPFVPSPPPGWLPRPVPRSLNGSPGRQSRPWSPVPVTEELSSKVEKDAPGLLFEAQEGRGSPLYSSLGGVAHRSTVTRNRRSRNKKRGRRVASSSEDEVSPSRRAKLWLDVIESTSKMQPVSQPSSMNVCTVNPPFAGHLPIPPPGVRPVLPNYSVSLSGPKY